MKLTFDDVLLAPQFSTLTSRKNVDISTRLIGGDGAVLSLKLPIISANMDTITGPEMAKAMAAAGGIGCLHRFSSVEDNVRDFIRSNSPVIVSVGLGDNEIVRAKSLYEEGAHTFCLDVAHGAQLIVVEQYRRLKEILPGAFIIVGNFGTADSVKDFVYALGYKPDAIKVGIGPGSACTTRIKTGCGYPQLSAIIEIAALGMATIADGGMRNPGDVAKALAAGAHAVMLGGMLAGTHETPGEAVNSEGERVLSWEGMAYPTNSFKKYRGSASKESYEAQGKDQAYITAEGESFMVPIKGSAATILADIEGGLRSAMTYTGAKDLAEFKKYAKFVEVSTGTQMENGAHGKKSSQG